MDATLTRLDGAQRRLSVYWLTVAFFAVVIAFGDGFWVTSVQGAVGAIERNDPPLDRWLRDSTLMLPLFFLAVLAAILLGRRWFGGRSKTLKVGATALLMVLFTSALAITEVAASSAYDYRLQSRDLTSVHAFHQTIADAAPGSAAAQANGGCTGICAEKQLTLHSHLKALRIASVVLLLSNVVLVLWVMALRGDRIWRSNQVPARAPAEAAVSRSVTGAVAS